MQDYTFNAGVYSTGAGMNAFGASAFIPVLFQVPECEAFVARALWLERRFWQVRISSACNNFGPVFQES
jgi:hypothetical protein